MTQIQAGGPPPIPLEVCDPCRVVWFDEAEYHRVFPVPAGRPQGAPAPVREPPGFVSWVTYLLLVSMVGISLWAWFGHREWIREWSFIADDPWRAYGATLVTAFFLHANPLHLIGNVLVLWSFGEDSEEALGRRGFLFLITMATVAGWAVHALIDPNPQIPCIGASGGIAGVLAYYCARFPHRPVEAYIKIGVFFYSVPMSAVTWLVIWGMLQLAGAVWQHLAGSPIAYGAHVGGALMGLLMFVIHRWLIPAAAAERQKSWWNR